MEMLYKEFAERYQDKGWDEQTTRMSFDRMMEQLTPLEILQAIPMFPEAIGVPASPGGASSGDQEYTPGSGWAQWNNEPWSTLDTPWSQLV
jgi:hypothetical protein